jgi:carboxypeptidase PM20D1
MLGANALVALAVAALGVYVLLATQQESRQLHVPAAAQPALASFDFGAAAERLARSLRVKTVSREAHVVSHPEGFLRMHELLAESYPLAHRALRREIVCAWRGAALREPRR